MTYALRISPRATRQIEQAADWWFENRSAASTLFSAELERGFLALASLPRAGERVEHHQIQNLRRILLSAVQFHLLHHLRRRAHS